MRVVYTLCLCMALSLNLHSQSQKAWLLLKLEQNIVIDGKEVSMLKNTDLNTYFKQYDISSIQEAFPYSKNDTLKRLYEIEGDYDVLAKLTTCVYVEQVYFPDEGEQVSLYEPTDPMWGNYYDDLTSWLWHLRKIQANLAWDIARGDASVKIAILDSWFDVNHPDLVNKMYCTYDPYNDAPFYPDGTRNNHGTSVASFAAAETDGGGDLASVGFNCMIIPYNAWAGSYIQRAHHASLAMNADVLTSSAGGWTCPQMMNFSDIERIAVKEILDNGTVIVMPAGNGANGVHCFDEINGQYQAFRPLHPFYDERIIIVTSTDKNDKHTYLNDAGVDNTHSHFPAVDICAPGYSVMGANSTLNSDGTPSVWPYYGFWSGTSFATPIVAGVCALIKSVNKCLMPQDIQEIIKATADPVQDEHLYPGFLGAGRINAYRAVQMAVDYGDFHVFDEIKTWDQDVFLKGKLAIMPGAVLTVTNRIRCASDALIIIHPGGKLIVDGGTITGSTACGESFWNGIVLLGNSEQGQLDSQQGVIELKHEAVIENAMTGICVGAPEEGNAQNGGIIRAENAYFINCPTSVKIKPYMRALQFGDERGNRSSFTSCTFVWNKDMNTTEGGIYSKPLSHVVLAEVGNILFKGCHFMNDRFTDRVTHGIYATDAKLEVAAVMEQDVYPMKIAEKSSFDNFTYGIRTEKVLPSRIRFAKIENTDFTNNAIGILNNGVDNSVFKNNTFEIGNPPGVLFAPAELYPAELQHLKSAIFTLRFGTGITLNQSTGYEVSFNNFTRIQEPVYRPIGILVKNSGEAPNEIKNNIFDNLYIAILCNGNNRSSHPPYSGLQLLCNSFGESTEFAIQVDNTGDGIAQYQGENSKAAGNIFRQENVVDFGHILNRSGALTGYFYNQNNSNQIPQYIGDDIVLFSTASAGACASSTGHGYERFTMAKASYAGLLYNYNRLIDGGSTGRLLMELEQSWNQEAWMLRDELLQHSPYLSEKIIQEVAIHNKLPHAMLLEVCLANPDATRDAKFVQFLRYDIPDPMPEYMCDLIIANQNVQTLRTNLEASLISAESQLEMVARSMMKYYSEDTMQNWFDSIVYFTECMPNLSARFELADLYALQSDYDRMYSVLDGIVSPNTPEGEEVELMNMRTWYDFMMNWSPDSYTILGHEELAKLSIVYSKYIGKAGERSKSLLYRYAEGDYNYHIEPNFPDAGEPKPKTRKTNITLAEIYNQVTVQPNPAETFTTFIYDLQAGTANATLLVTDSRGSVVISVPLSGSKGHYLWDTRIIASGTYLYAIVCNGQMLNSGKIIVKK